MAPGWVDDVRWRDKAVEIAMAGPLLPRHPASDEDMTAGTSANRPVLRHAPHQKLMSPLLPPAAEAFCDRHLGLPKRDDRAAVGVTQQIPQILNAPLLSCRERGPFGSANRRQSKVVCNTTHLPRLQDKCDLTSCSRQRRHHGQHTTHTHNTQFRNAEKTSELLLRRDGGCSPHQTCMARLALLVGA